MNRYAAQGILADLEAGKRVAVVTRPGAVPQSFREIAALADAHTACEVYRANGRERIAHASGGRATFLSAASRAGRGLSLDVIYVEPDAALTPEQMADLLPTLASTGGELIRA